jgi:hypothetical protein
VAGAVDGDARACGAHRPRRSGAAAPLTWIAVCAVFAGACGDMLQPQERIASTRPLALRLDVIEASPEPGAASRCEALPFETVRVTPFVVDPAGLVPPARLTAEVEPVWIRCNLAPGAGVFACLADARPLAVSELEDCPPVEVDGVDSGDTGSFGLPAAASPCRLRPVDPAAPEVVVPLDGNYLLGGDLELTLVGHEPGKGTTEACLEALLSETAPIPEGCLYAARRVPIGPDSELIALAESFGIEGVEEVVGAQPEVPQEPDRNPRIVSFTATLAEADGTVVAEDVSVPVGGTLQVEQGQIVQFRVESPESDLQEFYIADNQGNFITDTEAYFGFWFITWGSLLSPTSDDPVSTNEWRASASEFDEDELPPGGRAHLFYTVRDGRQGVAWWWLAIDVLPRAGD